MLYTPEISRRICVIGIVLACLVITGTLAATNVSAANQTNGLLFYLSAENGTTADIAAGDPVPNFMYLVDTKPGGPKGNYLECQNKQLLAYEAPGNIYAQRGTLAFYWRPRIPAGEAPFPIFRVSYADHSSWDLVWLRIDYNGSGFDAFVTDANLARPRVSYHISNPPDPDKWLHFALAWDETKGIRFYLDGEQVARKDTSAVFDAGLDQFGPHSRIISPYQVQSLYNYERGGDIDEICIFDRMLDPAQVAKLADGAAPASIRVEPLVRDLDDPEWRNEWWLRYGWNRPGDIPHVLDAPSTAVRKVEIHDVYDIKQWMWKGTDGIRETTWPYVYNQSRIPGRKDYFILPDWNCYSMSGKEVTFCMPDESWNHIEIAGAAYGSASFADLDKEQGRQVTEPLFNRPADQERTYHRTKDHKGGKITFTNDVQETPIGEFYAYNVTPGQEPGGKSVLSYKLTGKAAPDEPVLEDILTFIDGRYTADERQIMLALPGGTPTEPAVETVANPMPIVHILVPWDFRQGKIHRSYRRFSYTWQNMYHGLKGIAIDIPALDVTPTHEGFIPLNVTIQDPIWPHRSLMDYTFSVRPGEARTLWLDTRDRVLPNGYNLYLTVSSASGDFGTDDLEGAALRLVFGERNQAVVEQSVDRFTQVKDNVGNFVEEYPGVKILRMFDRYCEDMTDLFRVNPDHEQGRYYWSRMNGEQGWPEFEQPEIPAGIPVWAFRQVENMRLLEKHINWWIDERQIKNGEFGGGLSDDGDMTNQWPGPALMGIQKEKYTDSVLTLMDAYYDQNLFDGGLNRIITDELHVYEEGINVLPQTMLLDYGDPKVVERILKSAAEYERITGMNDKGARQVISTFYGGSKIFSESVWAQTKISYSYLIFHPGYSLVEYNGHPATKKLILELADGLLAFRQKDENGNYYLPYSVFYPSGDTEGRTGPGIAVHLLWAAYRWTGNESYLLPIMDDVSQGGYGILQGINANAIDMLGKRDTWGKAIESMVTPYQGNDFYRHVAWQMTGDRSYLDQLYAEDIQQRNQQAYMYTDGHWWSDRVHGDSRYLQRERLGGIALLRNQIYPGHYVSWDFHAPARYESMAILIPDATPEKMTIIAYNLETEPVSATLTGWDVEPGEWEVVQGLDTDDDGTPDQDMTKKHITFERTGAFDITFPARKTTILKLSLKKRGTPYWKRPDPGIGDDDVVVRGNTVQVTVHSLSSVKSPAMTIALVDNSGKTVATAEVPSLAGLDGFEPVTTTVSLNAPSGIKPRDCTVVLNPDASFIEITRMNNTVKVQ